MQQPETAVGVRAASGAFGIEKCEMTDKGWDDDGRWPPPAVASRAAWWNPLCPCGRVGCHMVWSEGHSGQYG